MTCMRGKRNPSRSVHVETAPALAMISASLDMMRKVEALVPKGTALLVWRKFSGIVPFAPPALLLLRVLRARIARLDSFPQKQEALVTVAHQEKFPVSQVLLLVIHVQPESLKTRTSIAGSARLAGRLLVATSHAQNAPLDFMRPNRVALCVMSVRPADLQERQVQNAMHVPPGEFSRTASSKCESCQPGAISIEQGASACDVCPAGKFEDKNQYCRECPPGWTSTSGNKLCTKCPAGFHASKQGSTVCDVCPAGKFAGEASVECNTCPPAEFSQTASSKCESCQPGAISIEQGSSACDVCPAAKFEDKNRYCRECPPGWTSTSGNKSCTKCPAGFHASKQGSTVCDVCPAGKFAGEASVECHQCEPGAVPSSQGCDACPSGRSASPGALYCEPCDAGSYALSGSAMCRICPSGHVSSPISASCHACEGLLVRNVPDEMQQTCILDNMEVLFAVLSWIAGTIFCHLLLTGLFWSAAPCRRIQTGTESPHHPHFVLTWQSPEVFFAATGALHLDQPPTTQWKVESHSFDQLTLHGDIQMPLDTSMGHLHFKFPRAFIATGHMAALKSLQRVFGFWAIFRHGST